MTSTYTLDRKEYYEKNKERVSEWGKEYYKENKEKINERYKKYYQKNREKINVNRKKYLEENKERIKESGRKYREENKKRIRNRMKEYNQQPKVQVRLKKYQEKNKKRINNWKNEYSKERRRENLEFNLKERLRSRFGSIFRYYLKTKKVKSSKKYGIDYQKIIKHLKPFPKDISLYHIDHIIPLASFKFIKADGTTDLEEIKKAFEPTNHQWLKVHDNLSKWANIERQSLLILNN